MKDYDCKNCKNAPKHRVVLGSTYVFCEENEEWIETDNHAYDFLSHCPAYKPIENEEQK